MNYLHSLEYSEGKDQLTADSLAKFQIIENYYIQSNSEESYEVQVTLSQILSDFLSVQKDGKSLEKIIGKDIKKYALQMLQAEFDREKGNTSWVRWVDTGAILIWLVLFLMFCKTFLFSAYQHLSFTEKIDHINISIIEFIIIALIFFFDFVRSRITAFLFFHPKLVFLMKLLFSLPTSFFVIYYANRSDLSDQLFAIHIPSQVFITISLVTNIYIVILFYKGIKRTNAKKKALKASEEALTPEQVICTSCKKSIDFDYPKCPYCGHINYSPGGRYEKFNKI